MINRNKILKNIIELQNITVFQQRNKVFDNFSLSLEKGENTVILGPNGAGKTTLLKLLNRELYIVENENSSIKAIWKRSMERTTIACSFRGSFTSPTK